MAPETDIQSDKVQAYLATDYRIDTRPVPIILRIGVRSDALAVLLKAHGANGGAFLTAFNPLGTPQSESANAKAHARLQDELRARGALALAGEGADPTGKWPPEPSIFAVGLPLEDARRLGDAFRQDAIVWVGSDAVPQLVLLR